MEVGLAKRSVAGDQNRQAQEARECHRRLLLVELVRLQKVMPTLLDKTFARRRGADQQSRCWRNSASDDLRKTTAAERGR
jgi:hypothetical protein